MSTAEARAAHWSEMRIIKTTDDLAELLHMSEETHILKSMEGK